jgi:hypothetical protein
MCAASDAHKMLCLLWLRVGADVLSEPNKTCFLLLDEVVNLLPLRKGFKNSIAVLLNPDRLQNFESTDFQLFVCRRPDTNFDGVHGFLREHMDRCAAWAVKTYVTFGANAFDVFRDISERRMYVPTDGCECNLHCLVWQLHIVPAVFACAFVNCIVSVIAILIIVVRHCSTVTACHHESSPYFAVYGEILSHEEASWQYLNFMINLSVLNLSQEKK